MRTPGIPDASTDPDSDIRIGRDLHATDWKRLADIMARAPLAVRAPGDLARAYANSFAAAFAWHGDTLIGGARAVSDGVFYATIYDVVVDPDWQGVGAGRRLVADLLDRLPFDKIFLTAAPGKQGFYEKLGFLRQTNAMGWYSAPARAEALARGVLVGPGDSTGCLASARKTTISE